MGSYEFRNLMDRIGEHIRPSQDTYDAYLLLDNHGSTMVYSTADALHLPVELHFELEDFVRNTD